MQSLARLSGDTMLERDKSSRQEVRASGRALLSVVTPAYNEAGNLPLFYERLSNALKSSGVEWEWIVIDDHSSDETFTTIADIASRDSRVRAIRLAKNSGSHMAINLWAVSRQGPLCSHHGGRLAGSTRSAARSFEKVVRGRPGSMGGAGSPRRRKSEHHWL